MAQFKKVWSLYKEGRAILGIVPAVIALFNNYVYTFIPLSPLLRLWATIFTLLFCIFAVGLTAAVIRAKSSSVHLRGWLIAIVASCPFTVLGSFGLYVLMIRVFESYSYGELVSTLFDVLQVGLFTLPFVCLSIGLVALHKLLFG